MTGTTAGVLALASLLLLPGLVIVRAPWWAVPFLSLSFWTVTWWWLPGNVGRERFVLGALAGFAALAALRLLKPLDLDRPSWPTLLVLAAALLPLAAACASIATPGAGLPRHAAGALLMVWRDAPALSGEPLFPGAPFPTGAAGFAGLIADVAQLSDAPAHRAASLVAAAALGLLHVAIAALLARRARSGVAVLATVSALAPLGWPDPAAALATACLVSAVALLVRGSGRSPAVAAGLFVAAALEADLAAAVALLALPVALVIATRSAPERSRAAVERFGIAVGVAGALVAPFALHAGDWPGPSLGTLMPMGAVLLAAALAAGTVRLAGRGRTTTGLAAVVALAAAVAGGVWRVAQARAGSPLTADALSAMAWIRGHSRPLDVVCPEPSASSGEWIPAVAGRATVKTKGRSCALVYAERTVDGPIAEEQAFRSGPVTIRKVP